MPSYLLLNDNREGAANKQGDKREDLFTFVGSILAVFDSILN